MNSKKAFSLIVLILVFALCLTISSHADVYVHGYYKKDGTYVKPHYRSDPDGNPYNNWSFPGNINPHTGKVAPGNPDTYLKNYYNKKDGNVYSSNNSINNKSIVSFSSSDFSNKIDSYLNKYLKQKNMNSLTTPTPIPNKYFEYLNNLDNLKPLILNFNDETWFCITESTNNDIWYLNHNSIAMSKKTGYIIGDFLCKRATNIRNSLKQLGSLSHTSFGETFYNGDHWTFKIPLDSLEDVYITIHRFVFDTQNYRYYLDSIKYYSGEILVAVVDQVSGKNSLAELKWQQPFPGRIDERLMNELTKYSEVLFNE